MVYVIAVLLPHVQAYNIQAAAGRLKDIAQAMGVDVSAMNDEQGAQACIEEIRKIAKDVGIPAGLKELGVKEEDFKTLAENALKDACAITNPVQGSESDVIEIFRQAM